MVIGETAVDVKQFVETVHVPKMSAGAALINKYPAAAAQVLPLILAASAEANPVAAPSKVR